LASPGAKLNPTARISPPAKPRLIVLIGRNRFPDAESEVQRFGDALASMASISQGTSAKIGRADERHQNRPKAAEGGTTYALAKQAGVILHACVVEDDDGAAVL
jgi:hypothetical protein